MGRRNVHSRRPVSSTLGRLMQSTNGPVFVGLDVHRKSVYATAVDTSGTCVSQERFGGTDAELIDYLDRLPSVVYQPDLRLTGSE